MLSGANFTLSKHQRPHISVHVLCARLSHCLAPCPSAPRAALGASCLQRQQQPPQQLGTRLQPLTPDLIAWFQERGISTETLQRNNVQMERRYCGALQTEADHIAFPYYRDGAMVNIKYRALPKHFSQVKGGQQILYGYDEARVSEWGCAGERWGGAVCVFGGEGAEVVLNLCLGRPVSVGCALMRTMCQGCSGLVWWPPAFLLLRLRSCNRLHV